MAAVLSIHTDASLINTIIEGYKADPFCKKLVNAQKSIPGIEWKDRLLYVGTTLVIPHVGSLHEDLFCLTHNCLGHFSFDKSYAALWDTYYWPHMCHDLHNTYILSCIDCPHNKSHTTKPTGPLHPLPIPDKCGDLIAIDFIGPCPEDDGHNAHCHHH